MEVHIFRKEMIENLKNQYLPGQFCFVLKKSLKVCFGQATYFQELSTQLKLQTLNSGKSQPNKATLNQVSMFISISHKVILKIFFQKFEFVSDFGARWWIDAA